MMLDGIRKIAPTGVMLMFAILYFGVMIDAGLFDPIVGRILRAVKGDPLKIVVGTTVLALVISLDGDGSTTYMIVVASMLPLYRRLKMNPLSMTCLAMLASGIMNLTPWGGPTARAASALHVDVGDIFVPLVPVMGVAIVALLALAFALGLKERRRLGVLSLPDGATLHAGYDEDGPKNLPEIEVDQDLRRPRLLWVNAGLTLALMVSLVMGVLPLPVLFMIAFAIALIINYPDLAEQRRRVAQHAGNVLSVVSLIFAAGIFTGILSGTGMVEAMSRSLLAVLPDAMGPYLADITALVSLPFTFFMSNDAFYFGVLPILSEAAQGYGISAVEMARASLIGQPVHLLSPLVPSTYLLVGLAGVEFGDHQRYAPQVGHDDLPGDAGGCAGVRLVSPGRQRRLSRRALEIGVSMALRIAYVTSGMGHTGTAICQALHRAGHRVVAGCGPKSSRKDHWLKAQKALGYDFTASEGDATDWESTARPSRAARSARSTCWSTTPAPCWTCGCRWAMPSGRRCCAATWTRCSIPPSRWSTAWPTEAGAASSTSVRWRPRRARSGRSTTPRPRARPSASRARWRRKSRRAA